MQPKKNKHGLYYYDQPPDGTKMATEDDFKDIAKCIQDEKPFIMQGFYSEEWYCHRVRPEFDIKKILPWLLEGKVYVWIAF